MKYYSISLCVDRSIIGEYPQCKGMPSNMGLTKAWFDRPNSFTHLNNEEFPDFEPDFIWELENKAKLTDVISPSNISAKGFLISEKVKEVISHLNLMEHKIYPATLIVNGDRLQYYWVHFKENRDYFLKNIDYRKSSFHIANLAYLKVGDIEVNSYKEFMEKKKELNFKYISSSKLYLNKQLLEEKFDLFYIRYVFFRFMASERLIEVLNAHNITGLSVKEQSIL